MYPYLHRHPMEAALRALLYPAQYPTLTAAAAAPAVGEHRQAVHDGYIWPVARLRMVDPSAIAERMLEDIADLVNDGGEDAVVTLDDLRRRKGWSLEQVQAHGERAFALYSAAHRKPRRRVTGNRSTVRRRSYGQEAAILAIFALPVALLARQMLGL